MPPDRTPTLRVLATVACILLTACERKPAPPVPAEPGPPDTASPAVVPVVPPEPAPGEKLARAPAPPERPSKRAAPTPSPPDHEAPPPAAATPPQTPSAPPKKPTPQVKPSPANPATPEAGGIPTKTTTGTSATKPAVEASATKPATEASATKPATEASATKPAPGSATKPAAAAAADAAEPAPPDQPAAPAGKTPPAPQAKVVATTPALNPEAEELARRDAGPAGPDYAGAPRRPRGGAGTAPPPEPVAPTKAIPGAPLNIPGSKVDFEARRVERFLDEGGATLAGKVLDADTGKGVDDAGIEAWMGTRSIHADTDNTGAFRFDGMVPGSRVTLWITATQKYVQERIEVAIPADRPRFDATFKLLPRSAATGRSGGIGVFLSRRAGRTVVSGLDAFGPAERAGLSLGDAIVAIGKRNVSELGPGAIEYLLRGTIGEDVEISVASAPGTASARKITLKRAGR